MSQDRTVPGIDAEEVTTSDSGNPSYRALWVGGAGDLRVTMKGGADVTFAGVNAGQWMPIQVQRVWATNTTATSIVGIL